ncbi:tRNA pseudouridine(55) synthase TruB [Cytobacillus spongiae]|uniref:tRNA pseudouridine(55) synthase TruB n=1 Tax=Cytobacillus spongiae TaxID=2901381 RepID=UPI001F42227E|nr:tRNA pseudouridine(55) synthase TruB [Cytobacillus spongiae]UII57455.1 tRNA pseudouridine(55) synthase TruB [Cytobacillus spongiae]
MEGILPLFKPKGMTSHDCVFKLRKILRTKKVGHTGTLDPDVTGVLPICIGRATKVAEYITDAGKAYEGEVTIGFSTTTEDASGDVVAERKVSGSLKREDILAVIQSLTGEIQQTPPMYSAVKVNGKRLYEYARQGIEVERPTRKVTIYSIELLDDRDVFTGETITFKFRVSCSKGTYIRTLAVMMGEQLGYPAHMSELTRIQSSSFAVKDCLTFTEIEEHMEKGTIDDVLRPLEMALSHLPKYQINDTVAEKVKNGAVLSIPAELSMIKGPIAIETSDGLVLAIYEHHPTKPGLMKPSKVLRND